MLADGVDVKTVQSILGHSSLDITLRYLHTRSESKQKAINKLSKRYFRTSQKVATEAKEQAQTIEVKMFKNLPH